jgi:hypothetical protein
VPGAALKNLFRAFRPQWIHGRYLFTTGDRRLRGGDARTHLGDGAHMNLTQDLLLAVAVVMFLYIGYAMFKPEKF